MITSYALVKITPSKDKEVNKALIEFNEVKEIVMTYGKFDLLVKVETESLDELDHFIFNKLRTTEGVIITTTLLQVEPRNKDDRNDDFVHLNDHP